MGRITTRRRIVRITTGPDAAGPTTRPDTLAVEEPLEIRVAGAPLTVTMRTPGHDVELAAGYLVSEGVIASADQFASAIHCGGPGAPGAAGSGEYALGSAGSDGGNTYNVLDVALAAGVPAPDPARARHAWTSSACGVCGAASIEQVATVSAFDVAADPLRVDAGMLAGLPDALRDRQTVFDKTGGLHAAALCDGATGEVLVVREDVGRHNAVDKVIGWALLAGRLPLAGTVLQVSSRASFELVQKAVMAGIPLLSAVSAPSSLAVDMAEDRGLTLAAFVRGASMNVYSRPDRIVTA